MSATTTIDLGAFRLDRRIGRGGMAEVWLGHHVETGTEIAVKVITSDRAQDPWHVDRFRKEVQALARLNHPGIVSVYEHGLIDERAASQSDGAFVAGSPFMVMEYAAGGTLGDQLPVQSWPELRLLLDSMLDALAYAHARDVIHRDLKPENVLCFPRADERLQVKLADFGIAQAMHPRDQDWASGSRASAGTPTYMAPEQSRGDWRTFGPWTDLYALGCMTYALVCGSPPFRSSSVLQLALDHMQSARPALAPRFPVPDELEWWIHKLMQPRSEDRFQRPAIAARALDDVALSALSGAFEAVGPDPDEPAESHSDDDTVPLDSGTLDITPAPDSADTLEDTRDTTYHHVKSVLPSKRLALSPPPSAAGDARRDAKIPIPDDFRRHWTPTRPEIAGVGLGLFGLRDVELVDRDVERRALWDALRTTREDGQTRVVVLRGAAGTGKSRLVEWFTRRSHELGLVDSMRATHDQIPGPSDGLRGMMRRFFRAWNIGRKSLHEHLQQVLERYFPWDDPDFDGDSAEGARALTELIKPAPADEANVLGPRFQFSSLEDQFALIQRVIDRAASKHTMICWLDNVQWGAQSLDFVEFALEHAPDTPAVYVLTVRPEELEHSFDAARRLEVVLEHDASTVIDVEPLGERDHRRLVRALLPMTQELEDRVVSKTLGQPIIAAQVIGSWVQEGLLQPGLDGFQPRPDARLDLVADVHQIWLRRLRDVLADYEAPSALDAIRGLEAAAALGRAIDVDEWHLTCGLLGIRVPSGLVSDLVDAGLVERETSSITLVHTLFQKSLELSAREADRWKGAKRACAMALDHLYADRTQEFARRRARYFEAAGEYSDAAEALLAAAHFAESRGFSGRSVELLDERDRLLDRIDVGEDDRRRIEGYAARMRPMIQVGAIDKTRELLERVLRVSRREGWRELEAFALRIESGLYRAIGEPAKALESAQRGIDLLQDAGPNGDRGWLEINVGEVFWERSDYSSAREHYKSAKSEFERADAPYAALKAHTMIAFTHIYEREFDTARPIAVETLEEARRLGDAWSEGEAWNQLGEIARLQGRLGEAHEHYQRLLRTLQRRDPRNRAIAEFNVAIVETALLHPDARGRLEWLESTLPGSSEETYLPLIHWCYAGLAASEGDWDAWNTHLERAVRAIDPTPEHLSDTAWVATVVAELTRQATDDASRIERVDRIARDLRKQEGHAVGDDFYAEMR